jgi:hypothetical protein
MHNNQLLATIAIMRELAALAGGSSRRMRCCLAEYLRSLQVKKVMVSGKVWQGTGSKVVVIEMIEALTAGR